MILMNDPGRLFGKTLDYLENDAGGDEAEGVFTDPGVPDNRHFLEGLRVLICSGGA